MNKKVKSLLKSNNLTSFCDKLAKDCELMIFGGFVRDALLEVEPNDLDIVVKSQSNLDKFIKDNQKDIIYLEKNAFGGYRFKYQDTSVDIWSLEKSINKAVTFEDCFLYVFFSCNAIGYIFNEDKLIHSENYFDLHKKEIQIVNKDLYLKKNHLWKNYMMKKVDKLKNHYNINKEVLEFLKVEKKEYSFLEVMKKDDTYSIINEEKEPAFFLKKHSLRNRDRNKVDNLSFVQMIIPF